MSHDLLTHSNFLLYCAKHYDASSFTTTEEFYEDINRIKYIKKLITRYTTVGELKERLILNHLIVLNNLFGAIALPRILFLKMPEQLKYMKPFLILLGICPVTITNVGKEGIVTIMDDVPMDQTIVEALRKI